MFKILKNSEFEVYCFDYDGSRDKLKIARNVIREINLIHGKEIFSIMDIFHMKTNNVPKNIILLNIRDKKKNMFTMSISFNKKVTVISERR